LSPVGSAYRVLFIYLFTLVFLVFHPEGIYRPTIHDRLYKRNQAGPCLAYNKGKTKKILRLHHCADFGVEGGLSVAEGLRPVCQGGVRPSSSLVMHQPKPAVFQRDPSVHAWQVDSGEGRGGLDQSVGSRGHGELPSTACPSRMSLLLSVAAENQAEMRRLLESSRSRWEQCFLRGILWCC